MEFLEGPARKARQVFILGDLFEYWIGDDVGLTRLVMERLISSATINGQKALADRMKARMDEIGLLYDEKMDEPQKGPRTSKVQF